MKNIFLKTTASFIISALLLFSSCATDTEKIPALLERKSAVAAAQNGEQQLIVSTYTKAKTALEKNPGDLQQYINIASAFISEGRITGNSSYYNNAALVMLDTVIKSNTANKDLVFQALTLRSTVLLNMHQFKDALDAAEKGVAINNFNSGIYGALIDANVELGNYTAAVAYCDKMMSVRPDLRSYSRASYLSQIYGQNAGAIEAMIMATEAGVPGSENTEWARTTLGDLYLNSGNVDSATIIYRTALVYRPGYPYALIGLAKAEKAKKNYDAAIAHTKEAIGTLSDGSFVALLADLYELKGDAAKAKEIRTELVKLLEEGEKNEDKNALAKHNVSRELAVAYMNAGMLDKALEYAKTDLAMRPENIDANELIGWIYYLKGDVANAKMHADKMLVTNTKNAASLYKAGSIYIKAGDLQKGNDLVAQAVSLNPYVGTIAKS